ncbi:MAG: hypothetical protein HZA88_24170 [Verrucomicrobia bacterium]|nr:hypothetical protein [Verrucomicrobiota bacterium]
MKDTLLIIRNGALLMQFMGFVGMLTTLNASFDIPCNIFGVSGLVVLLLTIKLGEPRIQKLFFILAGVAGAGSLIALNGFKLLAWFGHTPGGDGGGITVPMLILCPVLFLIGSIGAIVCLVRSLK